MKSRCGIFQQIYDEFTTNLFPNAVNSNAYALETQQGYASKLFSNFNQHQNTHVHFYSWSNYDMDKKFKSYGQNGETFYYIGKHLPFPEVEDGLSFAGMLPEYIATRQFGRNYLRL